MPLHVCGEYCHKSQVSWLTLTQVVLVEPLDFGSNKISVLCKPEMGSTIGHLLATSRYKDDSRLRFLMHQPRNLFRQEEWRGPRVVSDQNVARLTRQVFRIHELNYPLNRLQIALHCGLAAVIVDRANRTKMVCMVCR